MNNMTQRSTDPFWYSGELAKLQAQFPNFDIWLEENARSTIFVARRQYKNLHPHTFVTTKPAEMRTQLAKNATESESLT